MSNSRFPRLSVETLEARLVPSLTVLDLTAHGAVATAPSGAIVQQASQSSHHHHGHDGLRTFLRLDDRGVEQGYNSDNRRNQFDEERGTRSLRLDRVPVVYVDGVAYREFVLNVNQTWWSPNISLDELRIYLGDSGNLSGYNAQTKELAGMTAAFDLDAGGDVSVLLNGRLNRCNGSRDMVLLIPDAAFAGGGEFVYLYSKFGGLRGAGANGGAEEWSVRCHAEPPPSPPPPAPPPPADGSISGRVWFDANQDGIADAGDGGIDGVTINLEGTTDSGEWVAITTITRDGGKYSFTGLVAGNYSVSEEQPPLVPDHPELYTDGNDYLGSIEGTTDDTLWGMVDLPDRFADIHLGTDQHAVDYVFTEFKSDNL